MAQSSLKESKMVKDAAVPRDVARQLAWPIKWRDDLPFGIIKQTKIPGAKKQSDACNQQYRSPGHVQTTTPTAILKKHVVVGPFWTKHSHRVRYTRPGLPLAS